MSTFGGIVSEVPNISIDRFDAVNLQSTAFFLSHCHTDHMVGLQESAFINRLQRNQEVFLYVSELSFQILSNTNLKRVRDKLRVISVQDPCIVHVPASWQYPEAQELTVSAIPAGHCPGSVMFLLESLTGTVLYTGDIRIVEGDIRKLKQLRKDDGNVKQIQTLYLDTTFLDPVYNYFPKRKDSSQVLRRLIQEWTEQSPRHCVCIHTAAKYGSEYLFVEIFKNLKMKVHVSNEYFDQFRQVAEVECALTANPTETQVHACHYKSYTPNSLPCMGTSDFAIRHIKPSAMWYKCRQKDDKKMCDFKGFFKVAYSCHSSFSELSDIIRYLNPGKIVPCAIPMNTSKYKVSKLLKTIQHDNSQLFRNTGHVGKQLITQSLEFNTLKRKAREWGEAAKRRGASSSNRYHDLPSPPRVKFKYSDTHQLKN